MNIGQSIRYYRKSKGLTVQALSFKTGLAREVISKIENGLHLNPTIRTIEKIAKGLGVEVFDLFKKIPK